PYLQFGEKQGLELMWHAADQDANWSVEYRTDKWKTAKAEIAHRVQVKSIEAHRVYQAHLDGAAMEYRVKLDGKDVFSAPVRRRKRAGENYRLAVTGDCAQGTREQAMIAKQMLDAKADIVAVAGDLVYSRGLISEYRTKYFPIYNSSTVPLLRTV